MKRGKEVGMNELSEARSPAGAEAILAVLSGASVDEAYQRQGFDLPPIGSQVPNPIAITELRAGDVGARAHDFVIALGTTNVLVDGHVQPVEAVSAGRSFIGWFDPMANASQEAAAPDVR